jgi:hypothetical protein
MAFIDNSGDIILDAVLTDEGRKRLAAGDGSFRIEKFALADDEIDYGLYRNSNSANGRHPSGSAYYDLSILQSPVLEAFTNNTSCLKSKLINYTQNDFLYLPVVKLNTQMIPSTTLDGTAAVAEWPVMTAVPTNGYVLTADSTTSQLFSNVENRAGLRLGDTESIKNLVVFDQGLDTVDLNAMVMTTGDPRRETQFMVEVDNRLLQILPAKSAIDTPLATPSFIDDDQIATYLFMLNVNANYFGSTGQGVNDDVLPYFNPTQHGNVRYDTRTTLGSRTLGTGRYGARFGFRLRSSLDVETSTALFTKIGGGPVTTNYINGSDSNSYYFINTVVRVTGYTTGYRVDIPIKILKKA